MRAACHVARRRDSRVPYTVLVGDTEGKRQLGRPSRRREDNTKIDIQYLGWGDMYWIHLVKGRDGWQVVMNVIVNLRDSKNSKEILE